MKRLLLTALVRGSPMTYAYEYTLQFTPQAGARGLIVAATLSPAIWSPAIAATYGVRMLGPRLSRCYNLSLQRLHLGMVTGTSSA